jgi:hypothetical protein
MCAPAPTWPKPEPGTVTMPVLSSSSMQYTKSGCLSWSAAALTAAGGMVRRGKAYMLPSTAAGNIEAGEELQLRVWLVCTALSTKPACQRHTKLTRQCNAEREATPGSGSATAERQ